MSLRLIIEDDEGSTTIVPLGKESITIGRQTGNTIQLTEKNVSRRHARLTPEGEAWVIEDLGSYNGVKVNGRSVDARVILQEGDVVQIGDYHLALTEDVDRRSLNYDRPRGAAANDGEPMLASSSTNLPRLSQAELAALASGQHPNAVPPPQVLIDSGQMPMTRMAPPYAEEPRRNTGLLVGLGLVAIGAIALGGFWVAMNGNTPDKPPTVATNDTRPAQPSAAAPAPTPTPAAAVPRPAEPIAPAAEPEPTIVDDVKAEPPTPAPAPAIEEKAAPESDDGDVVVDDPPQELPSKPAPPKKATTPTKKPTPPAPTPPKPATPAAPAVDADALLAEARPLVFKNASQAYDLASKAYNAKKSQDAAFVMANAACRIPDEGKARKAIAKLKGDKRDGAIKVCAGKGISIE